MEEGTEREAGAQGWVGRGWKEMGRGEPKQGQRKWQCYC